TGELVEIHRVVRVGGEVQMVRAEAGVDQFELLGFRIEHRSLTEAALQRVVLHELVAGVRIVAPGRLRVADLRSISYAAVGTHHRVVRVGRVFLSPQMFHTPEVRGVSRRREARADLTRIFAGGNYVLVVVVR